MKINILLYVLLIIISCNNTGERRGHLLDYQLFDPAVSETDSLYDLFEQENFQALIDTFYFDIDSSPVISSLVEHFSVNTYSVTNIKCIMVGGKQEGSISLFKYNYPTGIWELEWQIQTSINSIRESIFKLNNSAYWLENQLKTHDDRFVGDFFRFSARIDGKNFMKLNNGPDVRLVDEFRNLVVQK